LIGDPSFKAAERSSTNAGDRGGLGRAAAGLRWRRFVDFDAGERRSLVVEQPRLDADLM
jgi:hypothetical protein